LGKKLLLFGLLFVLLSSVSPISASTEDKAWTELIFYQEEQIDSRMDIFDVFLELDDSAIILKGEVSSSSIVKPFMDRLGEKFTDYEIVDETTYVSGLGFAMVGEKFIDLLSEPGGDSVVTQLIFGDPVQILEKEGDWAKIQGPDLYLGWARLTNLIPFEDGEFTIWRRGDFYLVDADSTGIYESSDTESNVISQLVHGSRLHIIEEDNSWSRVFLPGAIDGWVETEKIKPENEAFDPTGEDIIEVAKKYMGTPYLWAGTHIEGADCSGYIQRVLAVSGIYYPRDSDQQFYFSEEISREEMKRGDLIFFSTYREGPSHLGIYLGNYEFIHASSGSGEVIIHSMDPQDDNYNHTLHSSFLAGARINRNFDFLAPWLDPDMGQ